MRERLRTHWSARAAAWDAENERIKRATHVKEFESMARREALAGQLIMSKALKRLQTMTDEEVNRLSVWAVVRMIEVGFRLERLGLGEPAALDRPYAQQNPVSGGDTPIMGILRRDPSRVQTVIPILAMLQAALAEVVDGGTTDEAGDGGLAYLNGDSGDPEEP